ncbi:MAG: HAMP domain-containing protein [Methylobacteriaceae bacterium]|nr:HAMP domain-containing protein [Methylobacteriaceae bacterium]
MTALGKLFRTTAFKLALLFLVVFGIGSGLVLGRVALSVKGLLDDQIAQVIDAEINGLSEQYALGGVRRLTATIERRIREPGASLYLLANAAGERLAGNIAPLPVDRIARAGAGETRYARADETEAKRFTLMRVVLIRGGEFRLVVGRDLEERDRLRRVMGRALVSSLFWLAVIGVVGGLFVAFRVLRRVDAMNATAGRIMAGDLAERLPVAGSNDEFDRLATNLNAMIARIGELLAGMREVSDNIAHDLKTPLTRLRNRAEEALRTARDEKDYRAALERMIEESDGLIRIFNALLMIARAEAGAWRDAMAPLDVGELVSGVAELYEPVAEEAGMRLDVAVESGLSARGNRELVSQAVANLLDNALKYGANGQGGEVTVSARGDGQEIAIVVADRGPGVAPADRARVLERFVRLEGSRSRPGFGLGLSLVAAVARLHGGKLELADNAPGLKVVLTLPRGAA